MVDPLSLRAAEEEAPDALALLFDPGEGAPLRAYTFAQLAREAAGLADVLVAHAAGEPIAVRGTNRVETALALLGLIDRGVSFVLVHPRWTEGEARAIAQDAGAVGPIVDDAALDGYAREALARPRTSVVPVTHAPDPERTLAWLYTSGTTGTPRGAALSRRAFVASARGSERNLGWNASDRWLLCLPLCHIGGLSVLTRCLLARKPVILLPRFDEARVCAAIREHAVTLASFVPTMLDRALDHPDSAALAGLRAILLGGAPASPTLLARCASRAILTLNTYGLTEACSQVTTQAPRDPRTVALDCGSALDGVGLEARNEQGNPCAPDEVGRVFVRGPTLFSGYRGQPLRRPDDWFDTGDFGALDAQGRLTVHARRTDLVVTGGENVYPLEVERALAGVSGVREALVFGVEDPRWGQRVAVALVVGEGFDPDRFAAECRDRLASHKRPRRYALVPSLPVTPAGKPDRRAAVTLLGPLTRPLDPRG
jgi:O-succinylbenzoic acid--CoA ligase